MGVYGEAATPDMVEAHGKIVRLAMNGRENGRENVLINGMEWWAL